MPASIIKETPVLDWDALEEHTATVSLTPRTGLTLDDYGTFTLTVREDPQFPRTGAQLKALETADPIADGWPVVATGTGTAEEDDTEVLIDVTVPSGAGYRRYAVDVVADGGAAGRVTVVRCTFLTVTPTLFAG